MEKIITRRAFVNENDNLITLKDKTQKLEYLAFPEV